MQMLTIKQAAAEVDGLSEYALRQMIKRGELPVVRATSKILINRQTLEEYLKGNLPKSKDESTVLPFKQIVPVKAKL